MARAVDLDPDQEMAGEGQALGVPALPARDVQVKDRQRDRQALAPLEHARDVGVLQVVVGLVVAAIAVGPGDHLAQPLGQRAAAVHQVGELGRDRSDMLAQRRGIDRLVALQGAEGRARPRADRCDRRPRRDHAAAAARRLSRSRREARVYSGARQTSGRCRGHSPATSMASKRSECAAYCGWRATYRLAAAATRPNWRP